MATAIDQKQSSHFGIYPAVDDLGLDRDYDKLLQSLMTKADYRTMQDNLAQQTDDLLHRQDQRLLQHWDWGEGLHIYPDDERGDDVDGDGDGDGYGDCDSSFSSPFSSMHSSNNDKEDRAFHAIYSGSMVKLAELARSRLLPPTTTAITTTRKTRRMRCDSTVSSASEATTDSGFWSELSDRKGR